MVDKVTRIMRDPEHIRNIAICAHIDHGKTTLSDNLLAGAGMMSEELAGKQLALDFHEDEQSRGITIDSASVSMVHKKESEEYLINLIDTPGHVDFGGDVTRAMRAVDGAVVLACAVEGIMPQTETVLRQALKERVKPILFINKVDRLIKELKLTPEKMQERFMKIIGSVNKLIKKIAEEEYSEKWQVNVQDGSVCFGSAFHNWAMSIDYMQRKDINFQEIIDAYENDDDWKKLGKRAPLHEVLLNSVIKHHPNPVNAQEYRIPKIWHGDRESKMGKSLISCNPEGPLAFVVIKVVVDPQAGEIAAGRLFSGTMKKGMPIHMNLKKIDFRTQQIYVYNGAKRENVNNVPAGNIIGLGGLKDAYPGETITAEPAEPFEKITHIFEPVITKSIEAKNPADLPDLAKALIQVSKEDPSIVVNINNETGENLISGMGELHLEIIENRIKENMKLEIQTGPPIVVYREAITKSSPEVEGKSPNKHNKVYIKVEPVDDELSLALKEGKIPEGRIKKKDKEMIGMLEGAGVDRKEARNVREIFNGNVLVDDTRGIVHIGEVIEMVMDMFEDVMKSGPIAHEPTLKIKVRLTDLKLHEDAIHRGPAQFYPAVRNAIRGAMSHARPLLFEPVQTMRFETPQEYMGEISKLIANKRGQMIDMKQEGETTIVIGKLPVAEMFGLSSELRSATGGRGLSSLVDQTFEKLPEELQDKIINQIRERKGLRKDDGE